MHKLLSLVMAGLLLIPSTLLAAPSLEELQKQIADVVEQIEELEDRVSKPERHAAVDRIDWYGDIRTKVDTLNYKDVTWNPGVLVDFDAFQASVMDPSSGFTTQLNDMTGTGIDFVAPRQADILAGTYNPLTDPDASPYDRAYAVFFGMNMQAMMAQGMSQADAAAMAMGLADNLNPTSQMMIQYPNLASAFGMGQLSGVMPFAMAQAPKTTDIDNDLLYTTRLRLGMKADIYKNMSFTGRLSMFKNWGDSTGVKVFDSWNAFTMDGTSGGSTSGDWLRVERAYFNWKHIADTPFYLSIGRRPSTYGAPSNYRENVKRGGTPTGHLVHFNFDGITLGYSIAEHTGIEGQVIRFCYGQGFESEWGNGELFQDGSTNNIKDTHLGGFNIDAYNDGATLVQLTAFHAMDVNDGFKGTFAFPSMYASLFAPTMYQDMQKFPTFNFVTRYTPTTVIGDINLLGLNFSREELNGFTWFLSGAMTQLKPNGKAGMFGGMGTNAVFAPTLTEDGKEIYMAPVRAEDDEDQEGYGIYVGFQTPAPLGKFGLEYNYGSQYWSPFTQSQDDVLGSKLATRGHAAEAYYIFELNRNAFIKVGGIYYDYEYTGSGSPVGKPEKIEDVKNGTAVSLMPVVDEAWDAYAQMSLKF